MRDEKPMIVGFSGLKGSGKGTAAAALIAQGFAPIKMAGPLKDMLRAFGLTEEEIEGDLKTKPCAKLCGKTPRFAMQTLGTEWGRDLVHPSLWTARWKQRALEAVDNGISVVADDVRFPNEAVAIKAVGGFIINIVGPDWRSEGSDEHVSEKLSANLMMDFQIVNDGTVEDLYAKVYNTVERIKEWIEDDGAQPPLPDRKGTP